MIIAIDGPAASGKSVTAHGVAKKLGIFYLDTGAMYRAVALTFLKEKIYLSDEDAVRNCLLNLNLSLKNDEKSIKVFLGKRDVTEEIRGSEVTRRVSEVSAIPQVREKMVFLQRDIVKNKDAVVEGRDIGTVVFPDADFKFFLTADYHTRAQRRQKDLEKLGISQSLDEIVKDLIRRDKIDSTRAHSPLLKSKDAIEVDTTHLTIQEQVDFIADKVKKLN